MPRDIKVSMEQSDRYACCRCGQTYTKRQGYFHSCGGALYKGTGYLSVCKKCVDVMYGAYLQQSEDIKNAVRQMCRALNIYWSDKIFTSVAQKATVKTAMNDYLKAISGKSYWGKSYDDTLLEDGTLWDSVQPTERDVPVADMLSAPTEEEDIDSIPEEIIKFWGTGYTPSMYRQLEERREYWMSGLPEEFDTGVGSEAIIKQICSLELDINRERAKGNTVDKLVTTLSGLIGSLNLKPSQKKQDDDSSLVNTPLGVWLYRYENERPLPVVEDENIIRKTVFTWMGHVCKMLGKKNAYTQLYEDEIARLRVEKPEYEEDDDEAFMMDILTSEDGGD